MIMLLIMEISYLNGHCFVSVMLCVPYADKKDGAIRYISIPLGYRMWKKKESKLELAASMIRQVMPEFIQKRQVIILCDSWYVKKPFTGLVGEYKNPGLIGNVRSDSVLYDLPPAPTRKRAKYVPLFLENVSLQLMSLLPKRKKEHVGFFLVRSRRNLCQFQKKTCRIREDVFIWTFEKNSKRLKNLKSY